MVKFFHKLWQLIKRLFCKPAAKPTEQSNPIPNPPIEEPENEENNAPILEGIDHVVVVMMENRSFDNVLGWLYSLDEIKRLTYIPETWNRERHLFEGIFEDTATLYKNRYTGPDGSFDSPPLQGASTNDSSGVTYFTSPPKDPWETFEHVTNQLFGAGTNGRTVSPWQKPAMNGFLQSYASKFDQPMSSKNIITQVMEGYTATPVGTKNGIMPIMNSLAKNYAVSDHWYCSVPTQTNANRAWMACGTSEGLVNNTGPQDQGTFTAETVWQKIDGKLTWKIYYEEDYFPLTIPGEVNKGSGPWTQNAFPWLQGRNQENKVVEIQSFHTDARTGNLPQFSFIEPSWTIEGDKLDGIHFPGAEGIQGNECHPPGDVRPGEQFIGTLYNSLIANDEAWNKTLFIITFDEHGGMFDHIPPPPAHPEGPPLLGGFKFDRYGVRVPTIFISPRITNNTVFRGPKAPNWIQSQGIVPQLDHTSIPATIMKWAGLSAPYGLGLRTDSAPTFDQVLNLAPARARRDKVIGVPNPNINGNPLTFGDQFYLKLVPSTGDYYLADIKDDWTGYYAMANSDPSAKQPIGFTFPNLTSDQQTKINNQPITHGSMLYITSTQAPDGYPFLFVDNSDAYYSQDSKDSRNQWVIKLASASPGDLGQLIYSGNQIFLENRDNVRLTQWLPGKLVPKATGSGDQYTTTTKDADYANNRIGVIVIEKA